MRLLIHNHGLAFKDADGIWIQSYLGYWVSEIAKHVESVGLLLPESKKKLETHDCLVSAENVRLESLGINEDFKNKIEKFRYIRKKCKSLKSYTHLLVRGSTPRQWSVVKNTPINNKHFLFVGCLTDVQKMKLCNVNDIVNVLFFKYRLYELKKISRICKISANSPITANEFKLKYKCDTAFIPTSSIQRSDFLKTRKVKDNNSINIIFVGRVVPDKGIEELIEAYLRFKHHCDVPVTLNIVGGINQTYEQKIKTKFQLDTHNVFFRKFITFGEELMSLYDIADVFVLPSYHEGFPHSIWEAASRRVPIITTKVGGIPGLIDEKMVTFIKTRDVDSIVCALKLLIKESKEIENKTENLYECALNYTVDKCAKRLIDELQE